MIISERIFNVMEQKNITQLELSRRTGIANAISKAHYTHFSF